MNLNPECHGCLGRILPWNFSPNMSDINCPMFWAMFFPFWSVLCFVDRNVLWVHKEQHHWRIPNHSSVICKAITSNALLQVVSLRTTSSFSMLRKMGLLLSSLLNVLSTQHQQRCSSKLRLMMGLLLRHSRLCFSQPCPNLGFLDPEYFVWAIQWSTVFSGFHSLPPLCCLSLSSAWSIYWRIRVEGAIRGHSNILLLIDSAWEHWSFAEENLICIIWVNCAFVHDYMSPR